MCAPELDRLHIFSSESLELGCHWLIPVPHRLKLRLRLFRLRYLKPSASWENTLIIYLSAVCCVFKAIPCKLFVCVVYLSMRSVRRSCGLQNERYVVKKVRTKLGSGKKKKKLSFKNADCWLLYGITSCQCEVKFSTIVSVKVSHVNQRAYFTCVLYSRGRCCCPTLVLYWPRVTAHLHTCGT